MTAPRAVPLPGTRPAAVVAAPPGDGAGHWAGAPSAVPEGGVVWLAYRVRRPEAMGRGAAVVLARSSDGERFEQVVELPKERFGAASLERPALVLTPAGRWRLYVSCATPGSRHWRIDLLEAGAPDALEAAAARTVFPGDAAWGVKDPVIRRAPGGWQAWVCCHPLVEPGAEDRMVTRFATSADGVEWTWRGDALAGRPGAWDARGARVTAVLPPAGAAFYDGRATREENFHERTGLARATAGSLARLRAVGDAPVAAVRYVDVLQLPGGGFRLYYEAARADGAHELRTEWHVASPARRRAR